MKSVLLIGLGRFGRHMAQKLMEEGNEVMAVDINEERVNDAMDMVTDAQIGDATNEHFVESLGVGNFDLCVVAIGDNFQSSLETTALLKDSGAPFVLARANRDVHAKFLLRNGADRVVYPEKEMAQRLAVKYGNDNIFDYIELTGDYAIYEIPVPPSWVGKSIVEQDVRKRYHISILATKEAGEMNPLPRADYVFRGIETLIVMGLFKDVRAVAKAK
ncbi:MAG TPA: TrkA family potassium uptake protein [Candidatus Blautia pullicola]|jgi:trk system potassium uptake protein TrkA|uniref:TrkA family potassium uptake protein n=1 Tax=Candidatus Blautia pullicola TaxID=2838498 RepID=A0A9D2JSE0_9FIRM|nr:TrkA family potassium uptake protein [Candidatus Blautia pullicola]